MTVAAKVLLHFTRRERWGETVAEAKSASATLQRRYFEDRTAQLKAALAVFAQRKQRREFRMSRFWAVE